MHVEILYVAYSRRLVKDAGALYLTFATPTRSSEIITNLPLYGTYVFISSYVAHMHFKSLRIY